MVTFSSMATATPTYEELLVKYAVVEQENALLKQQVEWFRRQLFGKKSERVVPENPQQLVLFPSLEPVEEEKKGKVSSHERRTPHVGDRIAIPSDLPIEREIVDLSEEEKVCKVTGELLVKIGEEVTRKLAHKPGHFFIKEIVRIKYAGPSKEAGVQTPLLPPSLLTRCHADESLLAQILIWKYVDHLPLYRQEECFAREGVILPRQVLSKWVLRVGEALSPLHQEMTKRILASNNVFIDETPVDCMYSINCAIDCTILDRSGRAVSGNYSTERRVA